MTSSSSSSAAFEFKAAADQYFRQGDFDAARVEIEKLLELNYSFLKVSNSADYNVRRVTVCIVAHVRSEDSRRLLETIQNLSKDPDFSFCLVSNSNTDLFADCPLPAATRKIQVGSNLGASLGRNAAIRECESEYIVFIDDDGHTSPDCIKSLYETAKLYDATAVRGRVIPKSGFLDIPMHYDQGNFLIPHFMDIEGMTLWRVDALKGCDFDPLLYGHEGIDLTARLYPHYGPNAFLYDPNAILLHDYGNSTQKAAVKAERMRKNDLYLAQTRVDLVKIMRTFRAYWNTELARHALEVRRRLVALPFASDPRSEVTVLTTCYNGGDFILQYAEAWKRQTDKRFRIVFVDDGSSDGSADLISQAFDELEGVSIIRTEHLGRGAALNFGLSQVETDIVLIADVDDIPAPQRIDWTRRVYESKPLLQVVGFGIFTTEDAVREQSPYCIVPTPLRSRALLGMPMPFPALSFRRSAMLEPFDDKLDGGVDCDWLLRNISSSQIDGSFYPTSLVFYSVHGNQMSASKSCSQNKVRLARTRAYHQSILDPHQICEEVEITWFTGLEKVSPGSDDRLNRYASKLSKGVLDKCPEIATYAVMEIYRAARLRIGHGRPALSQRAQPIGLPPKIRFYRKVAVSVILVYLLGILAWLCFF